MMTPQDVSLQKKMTAIEKLNLSQERVNAIESYLKGETSLEMLESFPVQDLSNVNGMELSNLMQSDLRKGRMEEVGKLFNALFSVGQASCEPLIAPGVTTVNDLPGVDLAKLQAVAAQTAVSNQWRLRGYSVEALIKLAGGKPETLRTAIQYSEQNNASGRLFLMACYFLSKYPYTGGQQPETSKNLLAGLGKIFAKKEEAPKEQAAGENVRLEEKDQKLLERYESIIVNTFEKVVSHQDPAAVKELQEALREKRVDENAKKRAAGCQVQNEFLLQLVGGTAYLNYGLSPILKSTVELLLAVDCRRMIHVMEEISLYVSTGKVDVRRYGTDFDKVFGIEPREWIIWAVTGKQKSILKAQFHSNRETYLQVMEEMNFDHANDMLEVIREEDPALQKKILSARKNDGDNKDRERLIDGLVPKGNASVENILKEFLRGKEPVTAIYPYSDQMGARWGGSNASDQLNTYKRNYDDQAFVDRYLTYMAVRGCDYFFSSYLSKKGRNIDQEMTKSLFEGFTRVNVDLFHQVNFAAMIRDVFYFDNQKETFFSCLKPIFQKYLSERKEEMTQAFRDAGATGRYLGLLVYGEDPKSYKEEILGFSQDSSKLVKETLQTILGAQRDWEEDIKTFLNSKKGAERELAVQILAAWNQEGAYTGVLTEALEKEKNGKVRTLLEKALNLEGQENPMAAAGAEDLVKEMHKGGKKRGLAWAYEDKPPFSAVHKKDGTETTEEYLQAIWLSYSSMNPCGVSPTAKILAQELDESEFALYANELFDRWMEAGAESKKRWVLYAAAIHGGTDIVEKLKHQISEWPQAARGAIACEAVQALALNPQPQALLIVDGISRKFKFKQVKEAAGKALSYAASQLGLTIEELSDKIVPDLGFDENMERKFDYGERTFTVTITTALEIEIFDENGKKIKSMPAPGKKDDEEKANAAYEEFKQLKKQMKATVTSQKMRLELALSAERQWTVDAWKDLFVKNPVMHQFAIGLIWGVYEDGKLTQSFRYMEDGSFNTEDEEEYELPQQGRIGLVHPIELTRESIETWKQQLEDYEITQPVEQLSREIFYLTEQEKTSKRMERYGGYVINALSLGGKLQNLGWYRGSVQDAGGFDTYYREDESVGLGAELHFSGSYVGAGYEDEVTVYDVRFYKAGTIQRGSYVYDEADDKKAVVLSEVPARYFSEIVLQLKKATASSQERDENWKKHTRF